MRSPKRPRRDHAGRLVDLALAAAKDDEHLESLVVAGRFEDAVRHLESGVLTRVVSSADREAWSRSFPSVQPQVLDEIVSNPFLEDDDKRGILDHFREDPDEAERTSRPYMERSRALWLDLLRKILLLMVTGAERPQ